jgi:hypothetical protein
MAQTPSQSIFSQGENARRLDFIDDETYFTINLPLVHPMDLFGLID